jgi:microcystin-dependent protein
MRFLSKNSYFGAKHLSVLFVLVLMLCTLSVTAQYSNLGFSFQGYAIDGEGKALATKGVTVRFTVYRTGVSYVEEHALTTDAYGVFVANVGKGTPSGATVFGSLDFNNFDFSLRVEVRETIGGVYATISDKLLQAVPYARSASNGVPVGTVVAFAGPSTNIPAGWLLCDGAVLNATTNPQYAQLFAAIGTAWGGTGVTSFNIPDLRGVFLRGVNGVRADTYADSNGSRTLGSFQGYMTALPTGGQQFIGATGNDGAHTHTFWDAFFAEHRNDVTAVNTVGASGSDNDNEYHYKDATTFTTGSEHTHWVGINGGGNAETTPKNAAVHYIIKY